MLNSYISIKEFPQLVAHDSLSHQDVLSRDYQERCSWHFKLSLGNGCIQVWPSNLFCRQKKNNQDLDCHCNLYLCGHCMLRFLINFGNLNLEKYIPLILPIHSYFIFKWSTLWSEMFKKKSILSFQDSSVATEGLKESFKPRNWMKMWEPKTIPEIQHEQS